MFQRLQQRMNRKKIVQETEPEVSSFYPDTEDGTSDELSNPPPHTAQSVISETFSPS